MLSWREERIHVPPALSCHTGKSLLRKSQSSFPEEGFGSTSLWFTHSMSDFINIQMLRSVHPRPLPKSPDLSPESSGMHHTSSKLCLFLSAFPKDMITCYDSAPLAALSLQEKQAVLSLLLPILEHSPQGPPKPSEIISHFTHSLSQLFMHMLHVL